MPFCLSSFFTNGFDAIIYRRKVAGSGNGITWMRAMDLTLLELIGVAPSVVLAPSQWAVGSCMGRSKKGLWWGLRGTAGSSRALQEHNHHIGQQGAAVCRLCSLPQAGKPSRLGWSLHFSSLFNHTFNVQPRLSYFLWMYFPFLKLGITRRSKLLSNIGMKIVYECAK